MVEFELDTETISGIASKFNLEEVEGNSTEEKPAEEIAAEEEATRLAAEEAEKNKAAAPNKNISSSSTGNDDEEESSIQYLFKLNGITDEDEDFKGFDVKDESVENVQKFFELKEGRIKSNALKELFDADPEVAELIQHKTRGGSIESFKALKQAEAFPTEVDEKDTDVLENVFVRHHKELGFSEKKINTLLEAAKDDDELASEVREILKVRKEAFTKEANARFEEEKAERIEQFKAEEAIKKELDEIVLKKGMIDDRIIIPEKQRSEFRKYLTSKEREAKWESLTTQQLALIDFMIYNDFQLKGIEKPKPIVRNISKRPVIGGGGNDGTAEMSYEELVTKLKKNNSH